ncbi:MAG: YbaN family protein [Agathobacter sp.]|nr:YbaN family protein [Agathobacter sp.]
MKKIVNGICVTLAFVCVGLGVIGIVLPILPTTPLFIGAACLFAKGSERFHKWFLNTTLYKKYIESAVKSGTMERKAKRHMMITLAIVFGLGIFFSPVIAKVIIFIVAAIHFYVLIFRIKSVEQTA